MTKKDTEAAPEPARRAEPKGPSAVMLEPGDHLVLKPGMLVRANGKDPVLFDGDISAFVNEMAALIHPMRIGVNAGEVERDVVVDGVTTTAKVPEYTVRLLDG